MKTRNTIGKISKGKGISKARYTVKKLAPIYIPDNSDLSALIAKAEKAHHDTISVIGNYASLDKSFTTALSKDVYEVKEWAKKNEILCDGKAISVLMITSALLVFNRTGKYDMRVITNDDLKAVKDNSLRKFYQCVRERQKVKREQQGLKAVIPAWKKLLTAFLKMDTADKKAFMKAAHLAPIRG